MTLTTQEQQAVEEYFDAIDKDGDGTIDEFELLKILEEMGEKPKSEDILKMLNDVNKGKTRNYIVKKDFVEIMRMAKQ